MKKLLLSFIVLFSFILSCYSYEKLNFAGGFISDNAKVITETDYRKINSTISELQQKTMADIAVVTVNSLQGDTIENSAVKIGRDYKVGSKEKNNGVVFLIAPNEHEARIEVGYGLENVITNSVADDIMNNTIIPNFKSNNYSNGIYEGVVKLANIIASADNVILENTKGVETTKSSKNNIPWWVWPFLILAAIFGRGSRGKFGGGGGFSGGHGSTGRW